MANHKSAKKRARQTVKRTARNTAVKSRVKTAVKACRLALQNAPEQAKTAFAAATRAIRKAASVNVLHRRTASRRVSRLARAQHKASLAAPTGSA